MMKTVFGVAGALMALSAAANAQTASSVVFAGVGSSAQFLELGQAAGFPTTASAPNSPTGLGASCVWSNNQGSDATHAILVTDPTTTQTETGNAWIAWTTNVPGQSPSATTCTGNANTKIYVYLQTDSVIGDRCFFNGCKFGTSQSPSGSASDKLIFPTGSPFTEVSLAANVWNAVNGALQNAAGTDIRPEDAAFATQRGTTSCNASVNGSNYRGLGYVSGGTPIASEYSTSTFHVTSFPFSATSSFSVTALGAVPIVVFANPSNASGFGSASFTNISRADLSNYLDGSWGNTSHEVAGSNFPTTVLVREPLSGTYNTMEYAVPNTVARLTSQDVGNNQNTAEIACDSSGNPINPLNIATLDGGTSSRNRVIGTGQMISVAENLTAPKTGTQNTDTLGYAFWSTANFAAATSANAKYVTVDGVDPLQSSYSNGVLPTAAGSTLGNVTFSHVNDGTYPIWSLLRLVSTSPAPSAVTNLAAKAQGFVTGSTEPDFIPFNSLQVLHSHFTPPGITYPTSSTPSNGAAACTTEAGGDVAGVILLKSASNACQTGQRM